MAMNNPSASEEPMKHIFSERKGTLLQITVVCFKNEKVFKQFQSVYSYIIRVKDYEVVELWFMSFSVF